MRPRLPTMNVPRLRQWWLLPCALVLACSGDDASGDPPGTSDASIDGHAGDAGGSGGGGGSSGSGGGMPDGDASGGSATDADTGEEGGVTDGGPLRDATTGSITIA